MSGEVTWTAQQGQEMISELNYHLAAAMGLLEEAKKHADPLTQRSTVDEHIELIATVLAASETEEEYNFLLIPVWTPLDTEVSP